MQSNGLGSMWLVPFQALFIPAKISVVWVNPVYLHTESWTARHVLCFISKNLAPHRSRRKIHEYMTAPCTTCWCTFHCEKGKVTGSGDWVNAEEFTVWFHSALSAVGVLDEWWLLLYNSITLCSWSCLSFLLIKWAILRPSVFLQ